MRRAARSRRPKNSSATSAMRRFIIVGVNVVVVLESSRTTRFGITAMLNECGCCESGF